MRVVMKSRPPLVAAALIRRDELESLAMEVRGERFRDWRKAE